DALDTSYAHLRHSYGGRRSVISRRCTARTELPVEIEGGSAARRNTRSRRRWRRRARLHRRGHRLERPQLMERRARLAQAGWTSGRGPQGVDLREGGPATQSEHDRNPPHSCRTPRTAEARVASRAAACHSRTAPSQRQVPYMPSVYGSCCWWGPGPSSAARTIRTSSSPEPGSWIEGSGRPGPPTIHCAIGPSSDFATRIAPRCGEGIRIIGRSPSRTMASSRSGRAATRANRIQSRSSRSKNASALWSLGNIAKPSSGVNGGPASQTQGRGMRAPVPDVLQVGTRYRQQCPAPLTDQAKGDDRGPGLWRR